MSERVRLESFAIRSMSFNRDSSTVIDIVITLQLYYKCNVTSIVTLSGAKSGSKSASISNVPTRSPPASPEETCDQAARTDSPERARESASLLRHLVGHRGRSDTGRRSSRPLPASRSPGLPPRPSRDLMDIQAVIRPGVGSPLVAGVDSTRDRNQKIVYEELRRAPSPRASSSFCVSTRRVRRSL